MGRREDKRRPCRRPLKLVAPKYLEQFAPGIVEFDVFVENYHHIDDLSLGISVIDLDVEITENFDQDIAAWHIVVKSDIATEVNLKLTARERNRSSTTTVHIFFLGY